MKKSHLSKSDATLPKKQFYTTNEVCNLFSIHRTTLAYWRKKGFVQAYAVKNSRRVLFKSAEIHSLISEL